MKATIIITAAIVFSANCLGGAATGEDRIATEARPSGGSRGLSALPSQEAAARTARSSKSSFTVYGTWNALQAISAIVSRYENSRQSHGVNFMPVGSEQIMGMLARHQCDVGIPFDSFAAKPGDKTTGKYERFPLARFVIAVAVNERNSIRAISLRDLQTAFAINLMTGPRSWKVIKGSSGAMEIEAYRPDKFCPEGWFFQKRVLFGGPFADEFSEGSIAQHKKESDAKIIAAIAEQANAIGFIRCPYAKIKEKRIRILGIAKEKDSSPIYPSPAALADPAADYPLAETITLYLHPNAPAEAREFCKYASGAEAVKTIEECGLWPEFKFAELRGQHRLADAKAHRAAQIVIGGGATWQGMMKELGTEFSKAKTAVEIQYKPAGQSAAIVEFVGNQPTTQPSPAAEQPSPPAPLPSTGEGRPSPSPPAPNSLSPLATQPSPPAPLPSTGEGRPSPSPTATGSELLLIDSLIDSETALKYDKAWAALKPREVRLGWRAAGIVVHPTNPLSVISYSQLRGIYEGKIKDWSEVAAGSTEYGVQSTKYGVKNRKHVAKIGAEGVGAGKFAKGAIQLYGPPPEDPISLLLESKLWVGRQHVAVLPRSDIGKLIVSVARDPLALGVVDLAEMPPGEASVKMLMIEPPSPVLAAPSRDKLPRDYFLARPVGLWVSSQGSQQAQNFADFVGSGECATTLRRYGLVPNIVPVKTAVPPMSASSAAGGKKR